MMRKPKAKRDSFWQTQMLPFVLVWAISIGIVGVLSRLWQIIPFLYNAPQERVALSLMITIIGTGLTQVFLVERLLKKSMRGWMLPTIASLVTSLLLESPVRAFFYFLFQFQDFSYEIAWLLGTLVITAPTSLFQAIWLRKRVKRAWLWPLVTIPLYMAFAAIPLGSNYQLLKLVMFLSGGIIQAGLMHYFWQNPKDSEKVKNDADSDQDANHLIKFERLERLQERKNEASRWDHDDHQALQSEA